MSSSVTLATPHIFKNHMVMCLVASTLDSADAVVLLDGTALGPASTLSSTLTLPIPVFLDFRTKLARFICSLTPSWFLGLSIPIFLAWNLWFYSSLESLFLYLSSSSKFFIPSNFVPTPHPLPTILTSPMIITYLD